MIISTSTSFYLILFYIISLDNFLFIVIHFISIFIETETCHLIHMIFLSILSIFTLLKLLRNYPLWVLWSDPQINFHHHRHHHPNFHYIWKEYTHLTTIHLICRGVTMVYQVCPQLSKEEEIGEAPKKITRNFLNPLSTEEIDNLTNAEMVKALAHRATLINRAEITQKDTIIELTRRVRANGFTISKLRAEIAEQKRQSALHGVPQK